MSKDSSNPDSQELPQMRRKEGTLLPGSQSGSRGRWKVILHSRTRGISKTQQFPRNFGTVWRVILNVLVIFIISQLIAVFIVEFFLGFLHSSTNLTNDLNNSAPAQFFYLLIAEGLTVAFVLSIIRRRGLKLIAIGLGRKPAWRDLRRGLIGFAAFYGLLIIATVIISALFPGFNTNQTQNVGFNSLNSNLDQVLAFAALVVLPPLGEETLVRGYLYSALRSHWKFIPAMLVTSLLFGLAHLQLGDGAAALWAAGLDTFVLSLILVYLRETTGALYAGMLVHSLNNVIAFGVHFHGVLF
jgi:membrane protease YdiL (CAAX protease family)